MAGIFRNLHATVIPVSDLAASRAWYEDVLGLEFRREVQGMLAVYAAGGESHVCLYVPEPGKEQPGYHDSGSFPNWRADDAAATRAGLVERGVSCTSIGEGPGLKWFSFFDPDRNRHDVCEYGPDWLP